MDKVRILLVKEEDVNTLFDLYKQTVNESFDEWTQESKSQWFSKDYSPKFWKELITNEELPVFAAYDDINMIGYAAIESITSGVAYLSWIAVLSDKKKNGIGSMLMRAIEDWCKEKGLHKIELETQIETLRPFFEKHGFVLEGVRKNSWQNLDNYMFGKEI